MKCGNDRGYELDQKGQYHLLLGSHQVASLIAECLVVSPRVHHQSPTPFLEREGRLQHRNPNSQLGSLDLLRQQHHHRSEEHTSELQSLMRISYAVFCLKKKNMPTN